MEQEERRMQRRGRVSRGKLAAAGGGSGGVGLGGYFFLLQRPRLVPVPHEYSTTRATSAFLFFLLGTINGSKCVLNYTLLNLSKYLPYSASG